MPDKFVPEIKGILRSNIIEVPQVIREASGIIIFGRRIKSLIFSTDVAIIRNTNADAVIAVYPFTPQPVISEAILKVSEVPVFCGVGGGITTGKRVIKLARHAEFQGAIGVVVNAPTPNEVIRAMREEIDIPIVVTVVSENEDFKGRIEAGTTIFNVSGAANTPKIVRKIREQFPYVPIIATGGPNDETIRETIRAGANAITYTPPTTGEIFEKIMDKYRNTF
ncbi:Ribulose-phosphate 3 epimerase family protein [Caloramator fervidus]|uniref:Ribulose-phosphate 3 epimerase family protein n=1 Tax=Caloramator fervidus TaxID=29344 RepID=A0A1H5TS53_9CLOT|nr:hydrolase [Caloramator fervidus]SEF64837.1 Ribulose-phosphate 3 epimerase family protein [Caloramator fervidus]